MSFGPIDWRLVAGIAVLVSGSLLAWLLRYGTAVVLPGFEADFGADAAALGALAAAYFWPYAAMQPFAGMLSDFWGPRRTLAVWLAIAGVGTLLFALAPTYSAAILGRALGGAGVGIVLVVAFSLFAHWFGERRFGTIAGLYAATGPLGGLLAAHPLAALTDAFGWRNAFLVIAAWLLLTALCAALILPGAPPRSAQPGIGNAFRGVARAARIRNFWPCALYAFIALGILSAMQGLWTLPFLTTAYAVTPEAATDVLQAWSIGMLVALPAWGYLADRVMQSNKHTLLMSVALNIAPWMVLCAAPAAWPADALFPLFLFIALMNGCWMPAYSLVNASAPADIRGSALGLLNLAFFLGAACFQQGSGVLLSWFSAEGSAAPLEAYRWLFGSFVVALAIAGLGLTLVRERRGSP